MSHTKRFGTADSEPLDPFEDEEGFGDDAESFVTHHALCPDCGQAIALVADEEFLPQHALCLSPWNPFGLTVCAGTGRPVDESAPEPLVEDAPAPSGAVEQPVVLLALPQGLDWRTQPFSHVGGPGSRPVRAAAPLFPQLRQAA
ncbi:hypothetical protein ACN20G_23815 [Streptomyces sp. BI20]|uniref:hypothetical protein n=1 Tax=Streptomyces sp. BI20 TaxID=3403460 RepID=UPI003C746D54